MGTAKKEQLDEYQRRLREPFEVNPKAASLNRQYLYQGTGFHSVREGGWGCWDPPLSWEACLATELHALTTDMADKLGLEAEAVQLLEWVHQQQQPPGDRMGRRVPGGPIFKVEHERCRQRYSGQDGYLSEEIEVVMRVGSRKPAAGGGQRLRFTSVWLCRALRPLEDASKLLLVRKTTMTMIMTSEGQRRRNNNSNHRQVNLAAGGNNNNNHNSRRGGRRGVMWEDEDEQQQVIEVLQATVEVDEGPGGGGDDGGDGSWVPVVTYAQEGSGPELSVLTLDLSRHEREMVLLCSCLAQHRREGSKMSPPRCSLSQPALRALLLPRPSSSSDEQEEGNASVVVGGGGGLQKVGVVTMRGEALKADEAAGMVLRSEVEQEVASWRAHVKEEEQDKAAAALLPARAEAAAARKRDVVQGGQEEGKTTSSSREDTKMGAVKGWAPPPSSTTMNEEEEERLMMSVSKETELSRLGGGGQDPINAMGLADDDDL